MTIFTNRVKLFFIIIIFLFFVLQLEIFSNQLIELVSTY